VRAREVELRALLAERIAPLDAVRETRLCGLLAAVELDAREDPVLARRVAAAAVEHGVLVRSLGSSIPLVPPLTVEPGELERIVETLRTAILETVPVAA
jgi:adenosylmethionine-8-amino-7-oxononanoate aminotransferase